MYLSMVLLQKLGSATLSVTSDSFVPTLSRIDECLHYINKNVSLFLLHNTPSPCLFFTKLLIFGVTL